jgi:hypothetical protein
MIKNLDYDAVARMLTEYLKVVPAERVGVTGGQYAAESWDMIAQELQNDPSGAELVSAFEAAPDQQSSEMARQLRLMAYRNPEAADRLSFNLDNYLQARTNVYTVAGDLSTDGMTVNIKQTSEVNIDVTEIDLDKLLDEP